MDTFRKEVSGAEKFMIALNEQRPPFVIQLVVECEEVPEPEVLHDALTRTTAANPGSRLALDKDERPLSWVLGPEPTLTVVDAPDFLGQSEAEAPFLRWAMDATNGPTCELVRVTGRHKTYLVFRALHAVMDGQGTIAWVKDFMRCLRGESPVGHPSTLSVDEMLREMRADMRPIPQPDALHPFGRPKPETTGAYFWQRVSVGRPLGPKVVGHISAKVAERARAGGVTGPVRINLPTDLRHYRPNERTTGNMFSALALDVPPGASPDAIGLKVVQLLYKHEGARPFGMYRAEETGSLDVHRVKVLWDLAHLHDTGLYSFSTSISHLGILKRADFSAPGLSPHAVFFVPLVGDSGCVVHLAGFDDRTEATVGLSDRFAGEGQLEELAEIVRRSVEA